MYLRSFYLYFNLQLCDKVINADIITLCYLLHESNPTNYKEM